MSWRAWDANETDVAPVAQAAEESERLATANLCGDSVRTDSKRRESQHIARKRNYLNETCGKFHPFPYREMV
jgi:hypothetical protein